MNKEAFSRIQEALPDDVGQPSDDKLTTEELLQKYRVTPKTKLEPMEPLFTLFDTPCFYRGELVADCGKAKSGKTLWLSIIMACTMKDNVLNLERIKTPDSNETTPLPDSENLLPLKVLWIDTEQSLQSTQDIQKNRIMPLAEVSYLNDDPDDDTCKDAEDRVFHLNDYFYAVNLRGLGYEKRRKLTERLIALIMPDLVIIDGIKDLVTDINDAVQATMMMELLMALAQEYNCCIVNVLHQNKSEADKNMRGSIGTELTNKAFEVFQCEYIEESDTFEVKHALSRKKRIKKKVYYKLNKDGLPELCASSNKQPRDTNGRFTSNKLKPEELAKLFTEAMEGKNQRPYTEVMGIAFKKSLVADPKSYYAYVEQAKALEIIRVAVKPGTETTWVELCDNALPF